MLRIRAALADLASKSEETRLHAARQAGLEFQRAARELSHEAWTKFSGELQERISELVTSSAAHEQLGGLALIQELTPLECEDHASKLTNFANFVFLLSLLKTCQLCLTLPNFAQLCILVTA